MVSGGEVGSTGALVCSPEWAGVVEAIREAKSWAGDGPVDRRQLAGKLFGPLMRYARTMVRVGPRQDQSSVLSQLADAVLRIIDVVDIDQDEAVLMGYVALRLRGGLREAERIQARWATGMGRHVASHHRQFEVLVADSEAAGRRLSAAQKDELARAVLEVKGSSAPPLDATVRAVRYGAPPEVLMPGLFGLGDGIAAGPDEDAEAEHAALANRVHMSLLDLAPKRTVFRALRDALYDVRPRNPEHVERGGVLLGTQLRRLFGDVDADVLASKSVALPD